MKRILSMILIVSIMLFGTGAFAGKAGSTKTKDNRFKIITTIFPIYDWTRCVLGDNSNNADLIMLLDSGVDLHSFQPTVDDIVNISNCDVFIYVGGESDEWVEAALRSAVNKDMIVINLLDALGDRVKEEELVEGMQGEEDEEGAEEDEEEKEYDEHVWLSLKNAAYLTERIAGALTEADPANAETYMTNANAYISELEKLDAAFEAAVAQSTRDTLLFADRFPFRYLTDDYGLKYYAAFVGCSAETEASFETMVFLTNKVNELGLSVILTIEGNNKKIAQTIKSNTKTKDQRILEMNSLQSVTAADVRNGISYLSVMEANLEVLKEALR